MRYKNCAIIGSKWMKMNCYDLNFTLIATITKIDVSIYYKYQDGYGVTISTSLPEENFFEQFTPYDVETILRVKIEKIIESL